MSLCLSVCHFLYHYCVVGISRTIISQSKNRAKQITISRMAISIPICQSEIQSTEKCLAVVHDTSLTYRFKDLFSCSCDKLIKQNNGRTCNNKSMVNVSTFLTESKTHRFSLIFNLIYFYRLEFFYCVRDRLIHVNNTMKPMKYESITNPIDGTTIKSKVNIVFF